MTARTLTTVALVLAAPRFGSSATVLDRIMRSGSPRARLIARRPGKSAVFAW